MGEVLAVFMRGLIAVVGVIAVVAAVWTTYVQRDALASALAPAADLVDRLRGVSAADPAPAPSAPPAAGEGESTKTTSDAGRKAPPAEATQDAPARSTTD